MEVKKNKTMDDQKKSIVEVSNELLNALIKFREKNPDFTFSLRSKDSPQSKEKRLAEGQWFQGSDYIYVPLFKKGDNDRKIKTIGFELSFNPNGSIKNNFIEISFKRGITKQEEIDFHKGLATELGLELNQHNHGIWLYPEKDNYLGNLQDYITRVRSIALKGLKKYNLEKDYIVSEREFIKNLTRIMKIKDDMVGIIKKDNDRLEISVSEPKNPKTPLNQILFGPPGTGKTYNTINLALEIVGENIQNIPRQEIKALFDAKMKEGQIVFTTFHQSMSYEDFIEGIKPLPPKTENGSVIYKVQDGIFKCIANEARQTKEKAIKIDGMVQVLTEDLFEDFYYLFAETLVGSEEEVSNCILETQEGYKFGLFKNSAGSVTIKAGQKKTKMSASVDELKNVLFHNKPPTYKSYESKIINKILDDKEYSETATDNTKKNFVLIIDEINRGNIAQIFGELITLIEEDKRLGKDEALEVTLPYSKAKFGVPQNLYILGTMNTADRSVEALDTALRRRFSFIEMPPDSALIATDGKLKDKRGILNGIDLTLLLDSINKRIVKLLDKDHQIGHSYFMSIVNLDDMKQAFQHKIIPLLQEYFFGDIGKIGLVLGKGFFMPEEPTDENVFAAFGDYATSEFSGRIIYNLEDVTKMNDEVFKAAIELLIGK